ncbi:hypothetical protein ES703_115998 [subsurface metagenome]
MKITYTKHAEAKFQILKRHNFIVTKEQIRDILENPEGVKRGRKDRLIAQRSISDTHLIRVIYRQENDVIKVITFYPGRRQRYENQL